MELVSTNTDKIHAIDYEIRSSVSLAEMIENYQLVADSAVLRQISVDMQIQFSIISEPEIIIADAFKVTCAALVACPPDAEIYDVILDYRQDIEYRFVNFITDYQNVLSIKYATTYPAIYYKYQTVTKIYHLFTVKPEL